jgi:hypothetical protein
MHASRHQYSQALPAPVSKRRDRRGDTPPVPDIDGLIGGLGHIIEAIRPVAHENARTVRR